MENQARSSQDSSSNSSNRTYVLLGHDDNRSPGSQARRDSPPSSQQYSRWSNDERHSFINELVQIRLSREQTANEVRSLTADYWRERALRSESQLETSGLSTSGISPDRRDVGTSPMSSQASGVSNPVRPSGYQMVRVAAIRDFGSQGSTLRSSGSSQSTSQFSQCRSSQPGD